MLSYGRFTLLPRRGNSLARATIGLAIIVTAMTLLSLLRTRWKGQGTALLKTLTAKKKKTQSQEEHKVHKEKQESGHFVNFVSL